jgi:flagellin
MQVSVNGTGDFTITDSANQQVAASAMALDLTSVTYDTTGGGTGGSYSTTAVATGTAGVATTPSYLTGDKFSGNLIIGGHTLALTAQTKAGIQSAIQGLGTVGGTDYAAMTVAIGSNGAITVTDGANQTVPASAMVLDVSNLTKDSSGGGIAGGYVGVANSTGHAGVASGQPTYVAGDLFSGVIKVGGNSTATLSGANAAAVLTAIQNLGTINGVNYAGFDVSIASTGAITLTDTNNQNVPASAVALDVTGLTKDNTGGGIAGGYVGTTNGVGTAGVKSVAASGDVITGYHNGAFAAGDTFGGSFKINGHTVSLTGTANAITDINTALAATTGLTNYTAAVGATGNLTFTDATTGVTSDSVDLSTLNTYGVGSTIATGGYTQIQAGTDATASFTDGTGSTVVNSSDSVTNGNQSTFYFANGLAFSINNLSTTGPEAVNGSITATAGASTVGQNLEFQVGANEGQTVTLSIGSTAANSLGENAASYTDANGNTQQVLTNSVADVNVTTFKGSQDAIAVLDKAISDISTIRANLGAFESNVLQSNAQSLGVATTNLQAAQATIADTDMAATVVSETKDQILVQAATSALAFANQQPQSILKLLQ